MFLWKLFFYCLLKVNLCKQLFSFNPCFYGSYSFTCFCHYLNLLWTYRFNPCFYGSYSFTCAWISFKYTYPSVLILVFMEVILLRIYQKKLFISNISFNPCFYGSYSFTVRGKDRTCINWNVLILVFMEVILLLCLSRSSFCL